MNGFYSGLLIATFCAFMKYGSQGKAANNINREFHQQNYTPRNFAGSYRT